MDQFYIEPDYYLEGYFVYTADAMAGVNSNSTLDCVVGKIVETAADLVAEFTQTATLSAFDGSDMFAFAEAQLAIEVSLIRDNNIEVSAVFDCATDGGVTRTFDIEADSAFEVDSTVKRSRDYELHAEAAFSFDVVNDKIVQAQAQVTAESTLTATISHIQGADIVVDNFATVTAAVNVVTENTTTFIVQASQEIIANFTTSATAVVAANCDLTGQMDVLIRAVDIDIIQGGIYKNWQFPTSGPKFNQSVSATGFTPASIFSRGWIQEGELYNVGGGTTRITSNGLTVDTISTPGSLSRAHLNFANNIWYNSDQYSSDLQNWQSNTAPNASFGRVFTRIGNNNISTAVAFTGGRWKLGAFVNPNFDENWQFQTWSNLTLIGNPPLLRHNLSNGGVFVSSGGTVARSSGNNVLKDFTVPGSRLETIAWDGNQTMVAGLRVGNFGQRLAYSTNDGTSWVAVDLGPDTLESVKFEATDISFSNGRWFVTIANIRYSSTNVTTLLSSPVDKISFEDYTGNQTKFRQVFYFNNAWRTYTGNTARASTDGVNWTSTDIAGTINKNAVVTYTPTGIDYREWKTIDFWVRSFVGHTNDFFRIVTDTGNVNLFLRNAGANSNVLNSSRIGLRVVPTLGEDTEYYYLSDILFQSNIWEHVRISRNGSAISYYLNGQRIFTANNFNPLYGLNAKIQLNSASNMSGFYDELLVSKELYTDPSSTSFTVPTTPWTNDEDTLLLLHFDGDFGDDSKVVVDPQADLLSVSSVTAGITVNYKPTLAFDSQATLTVQIEVDRGADLEAFAEAALAVDATRIRSVSSDLAATATVNATVTALKTTAVDLFTDTSADVTGNVIVDAVADFDSVATKLAIAVKVGSVIIHAEVSSTTQITADKITDVSQQLASEFAVNVIANIFQDNEITISGEFSQVVNVGLVFDQFIDIHSEFTVQADASGGIFTTTAALFSEFAVQADASGGVVRATADLFSEFVTVVDSAVLRDNNIIANSEFNTTAIAEKITDIDVNTASNFDVNIDAVRIRDNEIVTEAVATKIIVAVKNVDKDIDMFAEFAATVDAVKITDIAQNFDSVADLAANVRVQAQALADLNSEFDLDAEGTTNITGEAHVASTSELLCQAEITVTIQILAFSNASVDVAAGIIKPLSSDLHSVVAIDAVAQRLRDANIELFSEFDLTSSAERLVDSGVLEFASIASKLSLGRLVNLDMKIFRIPPETRIHTITSETRVHRIRR